MVARPGHVQPGFGVRNMLIRLDLSIHRQQQKTARVLVVEDKTRRRGSF